MSMSTREKIAIMRHYENGGEIEVRVARFTKDAIWISASGPTWNWYNNSYRIKPEPKMIKGWVNVYKNGRFGNLHEDEDVSKRYQSYDSNVVACVYIEQEYEEGEGL